MNANANTSFNGPAFNTLFTNIWILFSRTAQRTLSILSMYDVTRQSESHNLQSIVLMLATESRPLLILSRAYVGTEGPALIVRRDTDGTWGDKIERLTSSREVSTLALTEESQKLGRQIGDAHGHTILESPKRKWRSRPCVLSGGRQKDPISASHIPQM